MARFGEKLKQRSNYILAMVITPGSKGHDAPDFVCITSQFHEYRFKSAIKDIWVKYPDNKIKCISGFIAVQKITGLSKAQLKWRIDRYWKKYNKEGWQFASSRANLSHIVQTKTSCSHYIPKENLKFKGISVVIVYPDGKNIACKSISQASKVAKCGKKTIYKYIDKKWVTNNTNGIQFRSVVNKLV